MSQLHEAEKQQDAKNAPQSRDAARVKATGAIWGSMIPLMVFSIPLTAIMSDAAGAAAMWIPLSMILGGAAGTVAIWNPFARRTPNPGAQNAKQVQQLEERIASLEMILNYEEKLLESKARGAQPLQSSTAMHNELVMRDNEPAALTTTGASVGHELN